MKPKSGITCSARNPSVRRTLPDRVRSYMRPARSAVAPTWAGKPMPRGTGFPARGFGTGRTLRPPSSAHRPQPSAVRLPPSAVPSDSCVFCASLRPTLRCPCSVVRRPSSAVSRPIRFLRLLRFFAANPPLSALSRPSSAAQRHAFHTPPSIAKG